MGHGVRIGDAVGRRRRLHLPINVYRKGYDDTSYTAKMQARYTDLIIFNKWELVDERRYDDCLDRVGDLDIQVASVKSNKGTVDKELLLGLDGVLAKQVGTLPEDAFSHPHSQDHQSEVEVISITLRCPKRPNAFVDLDRLINFLSTAPKDEIYRIKAVLWTDKYPSDSVGSLTALKTNQTDGVYQLLLNWAFARWTLTQSESSDHLMDQSQEAIPLRMTIICARYEANKWMKRVETEDILSLSDPNLKHDLELKRIL